MASRILLADDSITIQKVVNLTFADEGIEVVSVSNGEMAERRLDEVRPDLVLADIFMPGKNGYELCDFIKQSPQFSHVPVVLLVGAFEPFDQAEARRVRADAHLTKPFESRILVETVRNLIATSRPQTAPLPPMPSPEEERDRGAADSDSKPIAASSFDTDLSAMTEQLPSAEEEQKAATLILATPLQPGFAPQDQDFGAQDFGAQDFGAQDFEGQDSGASVFEPETVGQMESQKAGFEFSAESTRTSEFPFSAVGDQMPSATRELPQLDASSSEPISGSDVLSETPYEESGRGHGGSVPSRFGYVAQDMVLDFDQLEAPESPKLENVVSLDVDMGEGAAPLALESNVDSGSLNTAALEPPGSSATLSHQSNGSSEAYGDSAFAIVDQPAEAGATTTLLAADEPLGDLLFGERAQELPPFDNLLETPEMPLAGASATVPLTSEGRSQWTASSLLQYGEQQDNTSLSSQAPLDIEDSISSSAVTYDQQAEIISIQESARQSQEPFMTEAAFETVSSDTRMPAVTEAFQGTPSLEQWPEPENSYKEADESSLEIESSPSGRLLATYPSGHPLAEATQSIQEEYSSSTDWSAEEPNFAPVDIEPLPVDEPAAPESYPAPHGGPETGFAFTQAKPVEAESNFPVQGATHPAQDAGPAAAPASQATELSPTLVDEIVRRVVAQMSDQVVREIAWEVVPDCVERVIASLTRESLSNKT